MKKFNLAMTGILLVFLGACHKENNKDHGGTTTPVTAVVVDPVTKPIVSLGLNGGLAFGNIDWKLPKYLEGQFKNLGHSETEASLDMDLTSGDEKKGTHVNSGFAVKSCKPGDEAVLFTDTFATDPAEDLPDNLKTDAFEINSWTAESKTFKGRAYLKKRYKSEGDTGIYRIDVLLANEKSLECVLWNFVLTPEKGTSAEFIEGSDEYKALMEGLAETWKGLGADFEN